MKNQKKKIVPLSVRKSAQLVGIVMWSMHYHDGQFSRSYRMGCRASGLIERSNEIGSFMLSRWIDSLESYVAGDGRGNPPAVSNAFAWQARESYQKMLSISGRGA